MAAVTSPVSSAAHFAANTVMDTVTDQDYKGPCARHKERAVPAVNRGLSSGQLK